jgi:hypothetical protein
MATVSVDLGLIFAHDVSTGAQFYSLTDTHWQESGNGNIKVRMPGVPLPIAFVPQSPFALLGDEGINIFKAKSMDSDFPTF